jgi:hypothetical protein
MILTISKFTCLISLAISFSFLPLEGIFYFILALPLLFKVTNLSHIWPVIFMFSILFIVSNEVLFMVFSMEKDGVFSGFFFFVHNFLFILF